MTIPRLLKTLSVAVMAAGFAGSMSSCNTTTPASRGVDGRTFDVPAYRPNNPSAVRVKASVSNHAIYVMEGNRPLLVTPACFGQPGKGTPCGNFTCYTKIRNKRSNSYGNYPMPFWVEFQPAYGFHAGWVHCDNVSHGCVRMPWNVAPKFWALVPAGTPVSIASSQPEDATIGKNIARLNDGPAPEWPNHVLWTDAVFHMADKKPLFAN